VKTSCKYTKIGNTVFIQGRLTITGSSSPVGSNLNLGSMPFTPVSSSEGSVGLVVCVQLVMMVLQLFNLLLSGH
jgi:hypothetical protein